jgi:hypothetical protein
MKLAQAPPVSRRSSLTETQPGIGSDEIYPVPTRDEFQAAAAKAKSYWSFGTAEQWQGMRKMSGVEEVRQTILLEHQKSSYSAE